MKGSRTILTGIGAGIALLHIGLTTTAQAHSGGTNVAGCHAGTQPYHCHGKKNESFYNERFCKSMCGETEVEHDYNYSSDVSVVRVDCETSTHVYEGGIDKRSSLDSVQQALFSARITGKKPVVVIYNTDGKFGQLEHRIKAACESAGVEFIIEEIDTPIYQ